MRTQKQGRHLARTLGCLLSLSGLLASASVLAQAPGDVINAARQAAEYQKRVEDQLRRDIESVAPSDRAPSGMDTRDLVPEEDPSAVSGRCFQIDTIRIVGAEHLSRRTRRQIDERYAGTCIGIVEIERILAAITKDYIERGYVTTRAYLPQQDLTDGELVIEVLEGRLESILLQDPEDKSVNLWTAFPASEGDILNLRDLEQGVDQLNRLPSNNAFIDILPGATPGTSRVVVANRRGRPFRLNLDADNQGQRATGRDQVGVSASSDNLLGLNELLMFSHRRSTAYDRDTRMSDSNSFVYIMPLGYSTLSLTYSESNYVSTIQAPSGLKLKSDGNNKTASYNLDHVLYRDQDSRISVAANLTNKDSENFLQDQLLEVSSRELSILTLSTSAMTALVGGYLSADIGYAQGLKQFGALEDGDNLPDEAPRAQFEKYTLGLGYNRPFVLENQRWSWSSQLTAQYAKDPLYGSEQIFVGGLYSVRGHDENSLSGDHGYFVRNELSYFPHMQLGGQAISARTYLGYDFGETFSRNDFVPEGRLSGVTLGATLWWQALQTDLMLSAPVEVPHALDRESPQLWVRMSYSI